LELHLAPYPLRLTVRKVRVDKERVTEIGEDIK